jgi:hydroxyacylglutathione hydrolase
MGNFMIVEQIWVDNTYRNFNYLIACPETGEALAVDPLDHTKCLAVARDHGWDVRQILNTHEHGDHIGGNQSMIVATGAHLLAHAGAGNKIQGINRGLSGGDIVRVGRSVELGVLDTPGHTMTHICLLSHTDVPALFSGDTLFNAGAGNCHNGGHPDELYSTFSGQLSELPDNVLVYPGHDYIVNNLEFTLDREPGNKVALKLLEKVRNQDPNQAFVSTIKLEKEINTFFRLQNHIVIAQLREIFPDLAENPDSKTVFLRLRELRNKW